MRSQTARWSIPGLAREDAYQEGMIAALRAIRSYVPSLRTMRAHVQDCLDRQRASLLRDFYRSRDALCSCSLRAEEPQEAAEDPGFVYFLTATELQTLPGLTDGERAKVTQVCLYYTGGTTVPPNIGSLGYVRQKARDALCD